LKWTAYDHKRERFKVVYAANQKEAIKEAAEKYGIVPEATDDVRPRTGTSSLMTKKQFQEFMRS